MKNYVFKVGSREVVIAGDTLLNAFNVMRSNYPSYRILLVRSF